MKNKPTIRKVGKDGLIKTSSDPKDYVPIGKIVEKIQKNAIKPTSTGEYLEQSKSMNVDYIGNLELAVNNGKKIYPKDFFVAVLTKHEKALRNTFRKYFHPRLTCPTPNYDQAVYKYDHLKEEAEFIWVVPDQRTCNMMYLNKHLVHGDDLQLLPYVINFIEGRLDDKEIEYNKNIED